MSPACNPTDERLDVLIAEVRTLISEMKQMFEDHIPREVTIEHYKDIPPMDVPGRKPPGRKGK